MQEGRLMIKYSLTIIGILCLFLRCSEHDRDVSCKKIIVDKILSDTSTSSAIIVVNIRDKDSKRYPIVIQLHSLLNYFRWFEKVKYDIARKKIEGSVLSKKALVLSDSTLKYVKPNAVDTAQKKFSNHTQNDLKALINKASPDDERYILYTLSEKYCVFYYKDDESGKLKLLE